MDAHDPYARFAPFDLRRSSLVLEHEGSVGQLRGRWAELRERHAKAATINLQSPALIALLALVGAVLLLSSPLTFRVLGGVGVGMLGLAFYAYRRMVRRNREDLLDTRKAELVDTLLAELARRLGPERSFRLRADFRNVREVGSRQVSNHGERWTAALPPASEPCTHEWLALELLDDRCEVALHMRSLYGVSGERMSLRDDLQLELRGASVLDAEQAELEQVLSSKLERTGESFEEQRARLWFRGCRTLTAQPADPNVDGISDALLALSWGFVRRRLVPEPWRDWDIDGVDNLLDGKTLRGLLDAVLAGAAPQAEPRAQESSLPRRAVAHGFGAS